MECHPNLLAQNLRIFLPPLHITIDFWGISVEALDGDSLLTFLCLFTTLSCNYSRLQIITVVAHEVEP